MSRWFRLYDDVLDDPKVQRLPPVLFKAWINLLCLASRGGGTLPSVDDIAFSLRADIETVNGWLDDLSGRGLLAEQGDGIAPHNWQARQFKSDRDPTATERQRRKRDNDRDAMNGHVSVTRDITPPRTDTDTDTDTDTEEVLELNLVRESLVTPSVGSPTNATVDDGQIQKIKKPKGSYPPEFELVWSEWPKNENESKKIAFDRFRKLSVDDRQAVLDGVMAQALWLEEETANRSARNRDPPPRLHLSTFINERRWEALLQTRFNKFGRNPWQPTQQH
jgi:hypothetical protein